MRTRIPVWQILLLLLPLFSLFPKGVSAQAPAAPTNLVGSAGVQAAFFSWTASPGATSYNYYRSFTSGAEVLTVTGLTTTSTRNITLTPGRTVYYQVTAVNASGESPRSNEIAVTPLPLPPPATVSVTTASGQVTLNWSAVSSLGLTVTYSIFRGTTSGGEAATAIATGVTGLTYTDTGLTDGTKYYYTVQAVDSVSSSVQSSEISATPGAPPAPTNLVGSAGVQAAFFSWTASPGATSYNYYRSFTSGAEVLTVTGLTTTSTRNITLTPGRTVYYQVTAVNASGESPRSNEIAVTPLPLPPPATVSVTTASGQVTLNWSAVSSLGLTVTYSIFRGTTSGGEAATAIATGVAALTYTNTGLTNNTKYFYTVEAVDSVSGSAPSGEVSATPLAPPTSLTGTAGIQTANLAWTASPGATGYNVYRGTTTGGESATAIGSTGAGVTAYADTGVVSGTTYYYKVTAVNTTGESSTSNEASVAPGSAAVTFVTTDTTTGGNWKGVYGGDGFNVGGDTSSNNPNYPAYVTPPTLSGASSGLWGVNPLPAQTTGGIDPTTLAPYELESTAAGSVDRLLGVWYSSSSFTLANLNVARPQYTATATGYGATSAASSTSPGYTALETATNVPVGSLVTMTAGTTGNIGKQSYVLTSSYVNGTYVLTMSPALPNPTNGGDSFSYSGSQVALYMYDWAAAGRAQTISVQDATSHAVLSMQTVPSGLGGTKGEWLVWNISGKVNIVVTNSAGSPNCVLSGIFFGEGVPSVAPNAPSQLQATAGASQIALSWLGHDPIGNAAKYNVYRATTPSGTDATEIASGLTSTGYIDADTSLAVGHTYYYAVAATNGIGISPQSSVASAVLQSVPAAPTGLVSGLNTALHTKTLFWIPSPGATSYNVYRSTTPGGENLSTPYTNGFPLYQVSTQIGWQDGSASDSVTYYYKVAAVNAAGVSAPSAEVSVNTGWSPLGAANSFVTVGPATNQSTISWSPVSGASAYLVHRYAGSEFGVSPAPVAIVPANTGNTGPYTYTDTDLTPGTQYWYGVEAVNSGGATLYLPNILDEANTPTAQTGSVFPKYQILSVQYAPPGSASHITYTNNVTKGTTTTTTSAFTSTDADTLTIAGKVDILGLVGTTSTASGGWSETVANTNSSGVAISESQTYSDTVGSTTPTFYGLSHDQDIIYIWLNPALNFTIPASGGGTPAPAPLTWTGYSYNPADMSTMDVYAIPVGFLNGDYSANPAYQQVLAPLNRIWAGPSSDGTGPGLTIADYVDILKADPFAYIPPAYDPLATNSYGFSSGVPTSPDNRFTLAGINSGAVSSLSYVPGGSSPSYTAQYTNSTTSVTTVADTHQTSTTFEKNFSLGISIPLLFTSQVTGDLKDTQTLMWTNTLNTQTNAMNQTSTALTITPPPLNAGYTGPTQFLLYEDNVYGTFMLMPAP